MTPLIGPLLAKESQLAEFLKRSSRPCYMQNINILGDAAQKREEFFFKIPFKFLLEFIHGSSGRAVVDLSGMTKLFCTGSLDNTSCKILNIYPLRFERDIFYSLVLHTLVR